MADGGEVVVIGGGAIGVAIALELAQSGRAVTVLERGSEIGRECSRCAAGLITPSHPDPLATPTSLRDGLRWMLRPTSPFYLLPRPKIVPWLSRFAANALSPGRVAATTRALTELITAGFQLHQALLDDGLPTSFERSGILYVFEGQKAFAHAAEQARSDGSGATRPLVGARELRALVPALSENLAGGVFSPNDGKIDPIRFVQVVEAAARKRGVTFRKETEVIGFERRASRIEAVETTTGRVVADTFVMAAGVWSRDLLAPIGVRAPIEGAKGYYVEMDAEPGELGMPIHIHESLVIATPFEDRIRFAGTLELTDLDMRITRSRVKAIVDAAKRHLPGIVRKVRRVGRGIRPLTPDGLPMIGHAPGYDNLILAAGHGMIGIALAPVTGRIVRDLIEGNPLAYNMAALDPGRFGNLRRQA